MPVRGMLIHVRDVHKVTSDLSGRYLRIFSQVARLFECALVYVAARRVCTTILLKTTHDYFKNQNIIDA